MKSTAVPMTNPEIPPLGAQIPVIPRAEMLAERCG